MDPSRTASSRPSSSRSRGDAALSPHRLPAPHTSSSLHTQSDPAAGTPATGSLRAASQHRISVYGTTAPADVSVHTISLPAPAAPALATTTASVVAAGLTPQPPSVATAHGGDAPIPLAPGAVVQPLPQTAPSLATPAAPVAPQADGQANAPWQRRGSTDADTGATPPRRASAAAAVAVAPRDAEASTPGQPAVPSGPAIASSFPAVRYALSLLPTFSVRAQPANHTRASHGVDAAANHASDEANANVSGHGGAVGDEGVQPASAPRYGALSLAMRDHGVPLSAPAQHRREAALSERLMANHHHHNHTTTPGRSGSPVRPVPELQYRRMDMGPTGWASMPFAAAAGAATTTTPSGMKASAHPVTGTVALTAGEDGGKRGGGGVMDVPGTGAQSVLSAKARPPSAVRPPALPPGSNAASASTTPPTQVVVPVALAWELSPHSPGEVWRLPSASDPTLPAPGAASDTNAAHRGVSSLMTSPTTVSGVVAGESAGASATPEARTHRLQNAQRTPTSLVDSELEAALPAPLFHSAATAAVPQRHATALPDMSAYGASYTMPSVFGPRTPQPSSVLTARRWGVTDDDEGDASHRSSISSCSSILTPTSHRTSSATSLPSSTSTSSAEAAARRSRAERVHGGMHAGNEGAVSGRGDGHGDAVTGVFLESVGTTALAATTTATSRVESRRHARNSHSGSLVDYWAAETTTTTRPVVRRGQLVGPAPGAPLAADKADAENARTNAAAVAGAGGAERRAHAARASAVVTNADVVVQLEAKTGGPKRSTWLDQLSATLSRDMLERRRAWAGLLLEIAIPLVCTTCAVVLWAAFGEVSTSPPLMMAAIGSNGYDFSSGTYKRSVCYNDTWNGTANYIQGLYPCSYLKLMTNETAQCSTVGEDELPVRGLCYLYGGYAVDLFVGGMRAGLARVMPLDDIIVYQWMAKLLSWNDSAAMTLLIGAGLASNTRYSALQSSGKLYFAPSANVSPHLIATLWNQSNFFQYVYNETFDTVAEAHKVIKSGARGPTWALVNIRRFDETGLDLSIELDSTAMPLLSLTIDKAYTGGTSYDRSDVYYTSGGPSLMQAVVQYYLSSYVAAGVPPSALAALNLSGAMAAPSREAGGVSHLDAVDNLKRAPLQRPDGLGGADEQDGQHPRQRRRSPNRTHGAGVAALKSMMGREAAAAAGAGSSSSAFTANDSLSASVLEAHAALRSKAAARLYLGPMPFVPYVTNQVMTAANTIIGFVVVLAFLYPVAQSTRRLVLEKERRVREAMQIMGLKPAYLWASWFLHSMALMFIISFLMTLLMCTTLVRRSDAFCLFLVIFMFALTCVPLSGMVAAFFNTSRMAALMTPLIYFALAVPIFAMRSAAPSVYLGLSVMSPTCFAIILQDVFAHESGDGFAERVFTSPYDEANTAALLGFLVLDLCAYVLLMFYLDAVLPKAVGVSKHPLYFILDPIQYCRRRAGARSRWGSLSPPPAASQPLSTPPSPSTSPAHGHDGNGAAAGAATPSSSWCSRWWCCCCGGGGGGAGANDGAEGEDGLRDGEDGRDALGVYEAETFTPDELVVQIAGLRKYFTHGGRRFTAVRNLSWQLPRVGISVLLGHNGAGKTTAMNMMTGMLYPDGGDCFICGHSVRYELDEARHEIGFCPQHNILWPELTCREHLEFFARLKGLRGAALEDAVVHTLKEVDLLEKESEPSRALSGGMKRKLSVAIAFVGGSPLVFLDEPTAGMDVAARRHTWELLLRMSRSRSVLLTTHFMDEADLLGDRVAIMSRGQLKCSGSSLFLKSRLGVGYNISISIDPGIRVRRLDGFLQRHVPQAERLTCSGGEVNYRLPAKQLPRFPGLLNALDTTGPHLGIRGYAISPTTLEEIFLKIAHDAAEEDRQRRKADREKKRAAARQRGRRSGGGVCARIAAWLCCCCGGAARRPAADGGAAAMGGEDGENGDEALAHDDSGRRSSGWGDSDWGDDTTDAGELTATTVFGEASASSLMHAHTSGARWEPATDITTGTVEQFHHDDTTAAAGSAAETAALPSQQLPQRRVTELPPTKPQDTSGAAKHGHGGCPAVTCGTPEQPTLAATEAVSPKARVNDSLQRRSLSWSRASQDEGTAEAVVPRPWRAPREERAPSMSHNPAAAAGAAGDDACTDGGGQWRTRPSASPRGAEGGAGGVRAAANAAGPGATGGTTATAAPATAQSCAPPLPPPLPPPGELTLPPLRGDAPVDVVWNCEIAFSATTVALLQTEAMMRKRFYNLKRDRKMLCFQIICPVVCVMIAMLLNLAQVYAVETLAFNTTMYKEETLMMTSGCADYFDSNDHAAAAALAPNLRLDDVNAENMSDFYNMMQDQWFVHGGIGRYGSIVCAQPVKAYVPRASNNSVVLLVNASSYHEFPIAMVNYYNLLFRSVRGDSVSITVDAEVLPSNTQSSSEDSIKLLLMGIIIMVPFTFLPSNCVAWVVKERECKSRHLQEICGLRYLIYWFSNFVFDFTAYLVTMLLVITIFAIFQRTEYVGHDTIAATFTLFLVFGFCSTATAYLVQFAFRTHSSAQSVVMAVGFISGFLLVIIVFVLNLLPTTTQVSLTMRKVFRIFPTYAVGEGIVNLATLSQSQTTDSSLTAFSMETVGWPCVYMGIEGPLFLLLTLLIDHPYWRLKWRLRNYDADGDAAALSAAHRSSERAKREKKRKRVKGGAGRGDAAEGRGRSARNAHEGGVDRDERAAAAAAAAVSETEKEDSDVEDERLEVRRRLEAYRTALQRRTSFALMSDMALSRERSELGEVANGGPRDAAEPDVDRDDGEGAGEESEVPLPCRHAALVAPGGYHDYNIDDDVPSAGAAALRMVDAVDVVGLHKRYDSGKVAVHDLTFGVVPGEVFGFLGTNGAGKTTTMSILCQDFYPTAGKVYVCGYDIVEESSDALQCIGYCPQFDATLDLLTVEEHLRVFAGIRGIARAEQPRVVRALLQLTGLREYRDTTAAALSGGNRRKLSVALSLVGGPQVVILDEPSAGMDPVARREMWTSIQAFKKRCSIILCTHHLEEVEALADCVAIMVDGRLRCIGSKVHLKRKYGSGFEMTIRLQPPSSRAGASTPAPLSPTQPTLGAPRTLPPPQQDRGGLPDGSLEAAELEAIKDRVIPFILNAFPSSKLMEVRGKRLVFSLPKDAHLSAVFEHVQAQREALCISDYTVSQTSIEQVFLRISEEAEEAERIRAALTERKRDKENAQRLRRETVRLKQEKRKRRARRAALRAARKAAHDKDASASPVAAAAAAVVAAAAAAGAEQHGELQPRRGSGSGRTA